MDTINYFIAETELPQQSDNDQSYGPVSDLAYRVTSLFKGGSNPMAYAVTDGEVFIVSQINNPERVNLFLSPNALAHGVPVKYFVYRGLLKSDFLNKDNGYDGIRPTSSDDSEFIKNLRKAQNPAIALSLYADLTDDYFVDDLFVSEEFQFGLVKQGDSVGRFDAQLDYGFEIMLDETFFFPTLKIARKDINVIEVSEIEEEAVSRLQVLNYIDPAAYYGLFAHSEFSVGTNNSASPKSRTKEGVYEFIKHFLTKNNVYIDIRDVYGYPVDWFEDSPKTIKFTTDGTPAVSSSDSVYSNNHFPLKTLQEGFANVQTNENGQKYFILKLSLPISNYTTPLVALQAGYWLKFASKIIEDMNFSICDNNSGWSDDKEFIVFSVEDGSTTAPITTYLRLNLAEYVDIEAINDQIPDEPGDDTESEFNLQGVFAFHVNGIPEYQEPTIE